MLNKLGDIAEISSGLTFRTGLEDLPKGDIKVIQMRDLGDNNKVSLKSAIGISAFSPKKNQMAQPGDLIFRSRGQTTTAAIIPDNDEEVVVAVPLMRIRVRQLDQVNPDYLLWFINQPNTQRYFSSRSKNSVTLKMIGKKALEELEVDVPDLKTQEKIGRIYRLSLEEHTIREQLDELRELHMHKILAQSASGSRPKASNKKTRSWCCNIRSGSNSS